MSDNLLTEEEAEIALGLRDEITGELIYFADETNERSKTDPVTVAAESSPAVTVVAESSPAVTVVAEPSPAVTVVAEPSPAVTVTAESSPQTKQIAHGVITDIMGMIKRMKTAAQMTSDKLTYQMLQVRPNAQIVDVYTAIQMDVVEAIREAMGEQVLTTIQQGIDAGIAAAQARVREEKMAEERETARRAEAETLHAAIRKSARSVFVSNINHMLRQSDSTLNAAVYANIQDWVMSRSTLQSTEQLLEIMNTAIAAERAKLLQNE